MQAAIALERTNCRHYTVVAVVYLQQWRWGWDQLRNCLTSYIHTISVHLCTYLCTYMYFGVYIIIIRLCYTLQCMPAWGCAYVFKCGCITVHVYSQVQNSVDNKSGIPRTLRIVQWWIAIVTLDWTGWQLLRRSLKTEITITWCYAYLPAHLIRYVCVSAAIWDYVDWQLFNLNNY